MAEYVFYHILWDLPIRPNPDSQICKNWRDEFFWPDGGTEQPNLTIWRKSYWYISYLFIEDLGTLDRIRAIEK